MSDWINKFDFSDKENCEEYELVKSEILTKGIESFILNNTDQHIALIVSDFLGVGGDFYTRTFVNVDLSYPAFFRQIMLMDMDNINGCTFDSIFSFMHHFSEYKSKFDIIRDIVSVWTCDFTRNIFINRGMESNNELLGYMERGGFSSMIGSSYLDYNIQRIVSLLFIENMNLGNYVTISKGDKYYKGMFENLRE
jgi:hypothetical protein